LLISKNLTPKKTYKQAQIIQNLKINPYIFTKNTTVDYSLVPPTTSVGLSRNEVQKSFSTLSQKKDLLSAIHNTLDDRK